MKEPNDVSLLKEKKESSSRKKEKKGKMSEKGKKSLLESIARFKKEFTFCKK